MTAVARRAREWSLDVWLTALADAAAPPQALAVGLVYGRHADWRTGLRSWPSMQTVMDATGMSRRSVERWRAWLVARGWLTKTSPGGGRRPGHQASWACTWPVGLGVQAARNALDSLGTTRGQPGGDLWTRPPPEGPGRPKSPPLVADISRGRNPRHQWRTLSL